MAEQDPRGTNFVSRISQTIRVPFVRHGVAAALILLISAAVAGRLTTAVLGPRSYKVWVIGNFTNAASHRRIKDGFDTHKNFDTRIDGYVVEIEAADDRGDPAIARLKAEEITARNDTLLVIGHMSSTTTKEAIAVYQAPRPPIPIVLTSETNPDLAPPKRLEDQSYPQMRLAPTDKIQARDAATFAMNRGATSFWVVQDTHNPVYADYLAREFIRVIQAAGRSVLLSTTTMALPSVDTIRAMNIECVFFAGEWSQALILIRQVKRIYSGTPLRTIVLSDAAAENQLISQGGADVEDVYLMHPLTASQYYAHDRGYELYGKDARIVAEKLLNEAAASFSGRRRSAHPVEYWYRRLLGLRRVESAREIVCDVIRDQPKMDKGETGTTDFMPHDDPELSVSNKKFHTWQIKRGLFTDVEQNAATVQMTGRQ